MAETRQCPHCGLENDLGRSLCANCQTPLTAYAGQLQGAAYQGKLAAQVERLETRPPGVVAMVVFIVVIVVFWPLASVVTAFLHREAINAEGTNYLASAFGALGPLLTALVMIPIACVLSWLAWATWTQQTWTWNANAGLLIGFAVFALSRHAVYQNMTYVWIALAVVLGFFWFQSATRAWFGLS
jgi:hypothetical protein